MDSVMGAMLARPVVGHRLGGAIPRQRIDATGGGIVQ